VDEGATAAKLLVAAPTITRAASTALPIAARGLRELTSGSRCGEWNISVSPARVSRSHGLVSRNNAR
jgi:hypothetical protein